MARKKIKKKQIKQAKDFNSLEQFDGAFKLLGLVLGVFLIFYLIAVFINNNRVPKFEEEDYFTVIQYKEILAGETFNQKPQKYYVVFFDFDNHDSILYHYMIEQYNQKENSIPIYKVDLNKGFNSSYLTEESNKKVNNILNLKINGSTLIKIDNGKNSLYKEGMEEIKDVLN